MFYQILFFFDTGTPDTAFNTSLPSLEISLLPLKSKNNGWFFIFEFALLAFMSCVAIFIASFAVTLLFSATLFTICWYSANIAVFLFEVSIGSYLHLQLGWIGSSGLLESSIQKILPWGFKQSSQLLGPLSEMNFTSLISVFPLAFVWFDQAP